MTLPKILIPYDDSDCSKKMLLDLRRAGLPEKAQAVVFVVADTWIDTTGMTFDPALNPQWAAMLNAQLEASKIALKQARSTALKTASKLTLTFPHWKLSGEAMAELPGSAVLEKIKGWKPDLVVMGSHGRSAVGRLLFGSVSQKVLTQAHCNLRICRAPLKSAPKNGPLNILVAFDGSEESEAALETVLCRNWPKGTRIRLVIVIDPMVTLAFARPTGPIRYWIKNEDTDPTAWIERMASDQKKRIAEKGYTGGVVVLRGEPKRVLLEAAKKWDADCIFTGSRGLTRRERIVAGSVSTSLAMHAHCSVEVVHRLWTDTVCCENVHEQHRDSMMRA